MRVNMQFQTSMGINTISPDQVEEIHLATLEVLDRVGVNIFKKEALTLLKERGAYVDNNRVRIPAWMVQEALASAPSRVAISNRAGDRAMFLEKGRIHYGTGSATQYIADIFNGQLRATVKQDVANAAKIADGLKNVDFVMAMSVASDVALHNAFVHEFEAMVLNTIKPILFCANDLHDLGCITKIAEIVAGGEDALAENPFIVLYAEPSSPLQLSRETIEKMFYCAEKRVPVICGPAVMMGATGPVSAAGSLVIANCEILAGLVMHQLKSKGAPFIYGGGVPPMDMKTFMCSYAAPEEHLNSAAMVNMAQYYKLPVFTTSGCSDSPVFDQQAGMEAGFNLLVHGLAGSNLIHDLGYMGAGAITSMEMMALCDETVGMVKHFLKGIEIKPETLALDIIEQVGPGGNFFAEEHTFVNFKKYMHFPELLNRHAYDKWKESGGTCFSQRANDKVKSILENHRVPELSKDIVNKVKDITKQRDIRGI
ncbi:MAG: trimethylamine methyltransferase family protein [Desulfitobacteriia bacterium]